MILTLNALKNSVVHECYISCPCFKTSMVDEETKRDGRINHTCQLYQKKISTTNVELRALGESANERKLKDLLCK